MHSISPIISLKEKIISLTQNAFDEYINTSSISNEQNKSQQPMHTSNEIESNYKKIIEDLKSELNKIKEENANLLKELTQMKEMKEEQAEPKLTKTISELPTNEPPLQIETNNKNKITQSFVDFLNECNLFYKSSYTFENSTYATINQTLNDISTTLHNRLIQIKNDLSSLKKVN